MACEHQMLRTKMVHQCINYRYMMIKKIIEDVDMMEEVIYGTYKVLVQ
jgi:hypothetical protein